MKGSSGLNLLVTELSVFLSVIEGSPKFHYNDGEGTVASPKCSVSKR